MMKNEGTINWIVWLELQEKYSMMKRSMTLIIPASSLLEAKEKAKKYWKDDYEKENVRQHILPVIEGQEMELDNYMEMSIPNNPDLDVSWIQKYQICVKYFEEHGNLLIPARHVIDGVKIGQWIRWQRQNFKKGMITPTQKEMLEKIGMVWYSQSGRRKKTQDTSSSTAAGTDQKKEDKKPKEASNPEK